MAMKAKKWLWSKRTLVTRSKLTGPLAEVGLRGLSWTMRCNPVQRYQERVRRGLYLNIGCGRRPHPAFINLDYSWYPGVDLVWDILRPLPIRSATLEGIFSEHCLEHIPRDSVEQIVLKEMRRCLRPGALARFVVPDAELFIRLYHQARSGEIIEFPNSENKAEGSHTPMMHVNRMFRDYGHQFAYDYETLALMLKSCGFNNVRRRTYQIGDDPVLLIDSPERREESLYVEAVA